MTLCNYHVVNGRGEHIYQYLGSLSAKWSWLKRSEEGEKLSAGCMCGSEGGIGAYLH